MKSTTISMKDALNLLEDGEEHKLLLWKIGTQNKEHKLLFWKIGTKNKDGAGEILTYQDAIFVHRHIRGGTHTVRLKTSGVIRTFRDICLFEIDDLKIYL